MTLLAYDPDLLASLLVQMRGAIDGAHRVRSSDPAAIDALRALRRATDAVERVWAPTVHRLLATDPLAQSAEVLRLDDGGVRALAQRLSQLDVDATLDDVATMAMLTDALGLVSRRPELMKVLRLQLGSDLDAWVTLCDEVANTHHAFLYDSPTPDVLAARGHLMTALAAVVGDDLPRLDLLHPFAAALLVPHLHLRGAELAEVAHRIVRRWCDDPWSYSALTVTPGERPTPDPYPADVLFPLLLADPTATARYVDLAGEQPATLLQATTKPDLMHRLVLAATDPAAVDAEQAGRLLVPLLARYAGGWRPDPHTALADPGWAVFLADALAPWLLHLSPLDTTWSIDQRDQRRYMAVLVADDTALARLVERADSIRAAQHRQLATDGTIDQSRYAALMGMLSELTIQRRYDDEQQRADSYSTMVTLIVTAATVPMSAGAGLTTGFAADAIGDRAGFDPRRAAHDEEYAQAYTRVVIGALGVHAMYGHWRRDGTLSADAPPPPLPDPKAPLPMHDYYTRLHRWLSTLPGGAGGSVGLQITTLVDPWVNAVDVGEESARG